MTWEPIKPPSSSDAALYVGDVDALAQIFDARRAAATAHGYDVAAMLERHKRELAIETGLLERLYSLDRGTTTLLIEKGLVEDNVSRSSTNLAPEHLIGLLHDQREAIEIVYDWVSQARPLSSSGIKELHQTLTRRQEGVDVLDQFGRSHTLPLQRGEWKTRPNNPMRPDGTMHGYCPPEHVAAEIDRLLAMHHDPKLGLHPVVRACWLHHRFTEIHPFQDGNGRVARCLMNYVLIEAGYLPVVIANDDRTGYIDALESADAGDLALLVRFIAGVHVRKLTSLLADMGSRPQARERSGSALEASEALAATLLGEAYDGPTAVGPDDDPDEWIDPIRWELNDYLDELVVAVNEPFARRGAPEPLRIVDDLVEPEVASDPSLDRVELALPPGVYSDPIWDGWDILHRQLAQIGWRTQPDSSGWRTVRLVFEDASFEVPQELAFELVPAVWPRPQPEVWPEPWIFVPAMVVNGRVALAIRDVLVFTPDETPGRILDRFRPFADRALRAFLETLASVKSGRRTPPRGPSRG